ncbi:unnamed protein product, partial [Hapterophycus canaliculatus]
RPRVVVTLGGPPPGAGPAKGRVRVPYKQFLLIYSGKASTKDVASLAMHRKVELTGFASFMQFGLSFDYRSATWEGYYDIKASLGAAGARDDDVAAVASAAAALDEQREQGQEEERSDGGGGGGDGEGSGDPFDADGSSVVLFSSDGFRELERIAAAMAKEAEEKEAER